MPRAPNEVRRLQTSPVGRNSRLLFFTPHWCFADASQTHFERSHKECLKTEYLNLQCSAIVQAAPPALVINIAPNMPCLPSMPVDRYARLPKQASQTNLKLQLSKVLIDDSTVATWYTWQFRGRLIENCGSLRCVCCTWSQNNSYLDGVEGNQQQTRYLVPGLVPKFEQLPKT